MSKVNTDSQGNDLTQEAVAAFIARLTVADVERVYSGKHGCMCGCLGKYWDHGRMVRKVLQILQRDPRTQVQDGYILHLPYEVTLAGTRNYVAYLCKSA